MTPMLLTINGAVMNVLGFSGTNFFFSKFMDDSEKNAKDMIWHNKSFKGPETNGMKIEWKN